MKNEFKKFECLNFKITIEEIGCDDKWIATYWDKNDCLEVDRNVFEFESCSGALGKYSELLEAELNGWVN